MKYDEGDGSELRNMMDGMIVYKKENKMKEFASGGKKDLKGKAPYHLITKEMLDGIAKGLNCGILKGYEPRNWEKGLPIVEGHLGAVLRHVFSYMSGQDMNTETDTEGNDFQLHHLDNALTHLAMAVTQIKRGRTDLDDRENKNENVRQE